MKVSKVKRSISFVLAVMMLITTTGESKINAYAKDSDIEEIVSEYAGSLQEDISEEVTIEEIEPEEENLFETDIVEDIVVEEESITDANVEQEIISGENYYEEIMNHEILTMENDLKEATQEKYIIDENITDNTTDTEESISDNTTNTEESVSDNIDIEENISDGTAAEDFVDNIFNTIVPNVTVYEAYDKYISLELGVPEEITFPENIKYYYEVKVALHKENETSEHIFLIEKEKYNSQKAVIEMQQGSIGSKENWIYDIEVKLVIEQDETTEEMAAMEIVAQESQITAINDIEVKPYYEPKISLKKRTTTIYTTQQKVPVANVKFGKDTTVKDRITVEDITYNKEENRNQSLTFTEVGEDLVVYANATEDTALGKHTIKVTAYAPAGMYASYTTLTVNVVQGIEEGMLSINVPANCFYKTEGKALSFTAKAVYEKDLNSGVTAKKKKVSWEIVSKEGQPLTKDAGLYGYVTIKNGKVTIQKNYQVSEENSFRIKLSVAALSGNNTCVYSDVIEIAKPEQMDVAGEVVILQIDEDGNGVVTAKNGSSITSDLLGQIKLFKKGAPIKNVGESYTKNELEEYTFPTKNLTYKSSNGSVKIEKDGTIFSKKPAKNVKITVTVNDNSKQKGILNKLSVVYETPVQLGLKIEKINEDNSNSQIGNIFSENTICEFEAITDTRLKVTVMQKNTAEDEWREIKSHVNFSLSVKNGTVTEKAGQYNQYYYIAVSKSNPVIKLNDKLNKNTISCTLKNYAYPTGKAPKLSLKGSLYQAAYEKEQSITYTLKKNGKFQYSSEGKYVLISANMADKYKNEKNTARYNSFERVMGGLGCYEIQNNQISLVFLSDTDKPLNTGKYKLWFTFGVLDENGNFIPDTQMTAVTVTVKKPNFSKGSYKPSSKYNISIKEGGTVSLKGTGKNYIAESVQYKALKNANVKGSPNAFTKYFEIENNILKVKSDLSEEQLTFISSKDAKNDLYGYIDYEVSLRNSDGSYSKQENTVKIHLTLKESVRKFTIKTAKGKKLQDIVQSKAYADSKEVNLLYAYVTKGGYTIETDGSSTVKFIPKTEGDTPAWGVNNLTVYVVPDNTYEANRLKLEELKIAWEMAADTEKESAKKAFVNAIQKYGIKISVKVELPNIPNQEYAKEVVSLVNKERKKAGLNPVSIDEDVMYASYIRAKEIVNKFSHTRPDGSSCFTVLGQYNISYWAAGENIAMGYVSPKDVMTGWMNSPGHKANILTGSFTHMGVGCYEVNGYYYWVQLFIRK